MRKTSCMVCLSPTVEVDVLCTKCERSLENVWPRYDRIDQYIAWAAKRVRVAERRRLLKMFRAKQAQVRLAS